MRTEWLMKLEWVSPALESLWRASWQGALWAGLVWAVTRALPRLPSALRAALWWLVCLKFVLSLAGMAPIALPLLPAPAPVPVPESGVALSEGASLAVVTVAAPRVTAPVEAAVPWRQVWVAALLGAWVLGIVWQVRGHVRAWSAVRRLRQRALPLPHPDIERTLRELASAAGLRRVPRLLVSTEVTSPLATGLLSPVVVLPAKALRRLDLEALRMALAHELAHFQRRDLWLGWVPAIAESVLFFHPLARKAAREYALAREEACDAEALRLTGAEPGDYGQLLLAFGVTRAHGTAAALGASAHVHALHRRLTMLEHVDVSSSHRRFPLRVALCALGFVALVPFQVVAREPAKAPQPPESPKAAAATPAPAAPAAQGLAVPAAPKVAASPAASPVAAPKVAAAPKAPAPVQAPVPPPPPAPALAPLPPGPVLAMAGDDDDDDDELDRFVLVSGNQVMMAGSMDDLRMAKTLRNEGKDVLFVRRDDKAYVIRDAKTLEQVRAAFEPETKLGEQQAELGRKQAALGVKQAEFGQKQASLGMKQAELGMKQAEHGVAAARAAMRGDKAEQDRHEQELEKNQEAVDKEMDALGDQQEALGREQEKLGEQQEALGREQEKLGRQMAASARESRKRVDALVDEAVRKGLAEPVKD
ncbi:M56 family metallopeptidase [Hyalangium rubrum]|uniref:M56 family metallopeptidase n=1 Tax=Hyalangium rubrum TaxID=3103134 RepID=A0ABU5H4R6_9BACT|nr:M56 family metallopeptidase [Hyalangium sp. s54d21]MDY7227772.1 M56 family metallopeptidase [Hyalangium sp. s54d21]